MYLELKHRAQPCPGLQYVTPSLCVTPALTLLWMCCALLCCAVLCCGSCTALLSCCDTVSVCSSTWVLWCSARDFRHVASCEEGSEIAWIWAAQDHTSWPAPMASSACSFLVSRQGTSTVSHAVRTCDLAIRCLWKDKVMIGEHQGKPLIGCCCRSNQQMQQRAAAQG